MAYVSESMKCSRCGEEMKEGYVSIHNDPGALYWSTTEPTFWREPKESVEIVKASLSRRGKENWLRRAYRCEKCGLITFEEKYTLPCEEKS